MMRLDDYRIDVRDHGQVLFIVMALAFAGLFLVGLVGFVLAGLASYPSPLTASTGEAARYFRDSRDATRLNAFVQLAAAGPLLVYSAVAATRLRAVGDRSAAPAIALAAGTASAACLALSAISQWALSRPHTLQEGGALVRSLQDVAFMSGGPAHVGFLGVLVAAVTCAAWSDHRVPRWLTGLGALVAVLSVLSALTLLFDDGAYLLPAARFPTFVWLLATAVALPGVAAPRELHEPSHPVPVGAGRPGGAPA